ncbi:MAG TPA: YihY/virulence factor BrkB family protein [Paludibacter sp.]|nr:YihY/virulence factor BrkB family protein [Paludibacter sp.]
MNKLINFFKKLYSFILYDIWRKTEYELSRTKRLLYGLVKITILAIRGLIHNDLNIKASALTYSILFAVIPIFALIIGIGRGFGVDKLIENSLQETFIAQANMIPVVMQAVGRYLDSTNSGIFIGIGLVVLIITVMNFFMQVEAAFNNIWQVKKSRSVLRQFSVYFSTMLIIPILIVFSSGLSIYVNTALSQSVFNQLLNPIFRFSVKFTPFFVNWIIFTLLYLVIPNTKVKFINALIAGIMAGSAFQFFQIIYINGQVYLSRYDIVYGSFAAIPLLLLWLQISCLIVLLGAEISYAAQNLQNYNYEVDTNNISNRYKNYITLYITYLIVKQFENQKPPLSSDQLAKEYKLPIRLVNQILSKLVEVSVLIEVFNDRSKNKTYQPAFDINKLTVNKLHEKIDCFGSEFFVNDKNPVLDNLWIKTEEMRRKTEELSENVLIKDL